VPTAFNRKTRIITIAALFVGVALLVIVSVVSYNYVNKLSQNNNNLSRDYELYEKFESISASVFYIESNTRSYLFNNDEKHLTTNDNYRKHIQENFDIIEPFFAANNLTEELTDYRRAVYLKLDFLNELNNTRKAGGKTASDKLVATGRGVALTRNILVEAEGIKELLRKNINSDKKNSDDLVQEYSRWDMINFLTAFIITGVTAYFLLRNLKNRNKLAGQLEDEKKKAEDALLIKDQFMANMSHEIRTPMNAIIGFTSLLEKSEKDEKRLGYINAIKNSGENLLVIINDILDFSKLEAGMMRLEKIKFDPKELLGSIHTLFIQKAEEKNLKLNLHIEEKIPEVLIGDPNRLTQILVNLIANAIKFTSSGSVSIDAHVIHSNPEEVNIQFSIKDTGIGIPEDKIETIFERFNQGNTETNRKYGGTGLGLTIVKNLIELQKGTISIRSKVNQGSEFIFQITYPVSIENFTVKQPDKITPVHINKLNVLVVEDNEINQLLAHEVLSDFGFEVTIAGNGKAALKILQEQSFDIILLDIQMPVLDGYKTAEAIRNQLKLSTPIIAVTAHIMASEKEKCLSFGMNDYISKPFKEIDLYRVITQHIDKTLNIGLIYPKDEPSYPASTKINLSYLLNLSKGNNQFVLQMLNLFLEQNPSDLKQLADEIKNNNFLNASAIAHKMKTSVSFLGLSEVLNPDLETIEHARETVPDKDLLMEKFHNIETILNTSFADVEKEIGKLS
jgi:signal transduction histidine kinase/CheY-like chemotaxis protein/HPt (histidine-containing phosphotransfer) domain-containing protein